MSPPLKKAILYLLKTRSPSLHIAQLPYQSSSDSGANFSLALMGPPKHVQLSRVLALS